MDVPELSRRGYAIRKAYGGSAIDRVRNQLATDALAEGFDETFWIDSDILFHPGQRGPTPRASVAVVSGCMRRRGWRRLPRICCRGRASLSLARMAA